MLQDPLVTAVIITYNQERFIEQAIDSALKQKVNFNYEIVVGEDCSTDTTREICYRYQRMYPDKIRVITSDRNVGLLDNYYRTVSAARGKYIAVCGGDDYWHHPYKLQKQVDFLEQCPDYGMVHSDSDHLYHDSGLIIKNYFLSKGIRRDGNLGEPLELLMSQKGPIIACTMVFRKAMFDQYFDIDMLKRNGFMLEDAPLVIEIAAHSKIHYMPESFATYRHLNESVSRSKEIKRTLPFAISVAEMYLYYCRKYSLPKHIRQFHEKVWRRRSLQLAFYTKDSDLAEAVKGRYPKLSIKDWFWYLGSKYHAIRPFVAVIHNLRRKFK